MIQKYVLVNMIGFFANSAIPILLSPLYFRYFGATDFGLIATVNGILVLTSAMDFGIASVLSQRLAGNFHNGRIAIPAQDFVLYVATIACLSLLIGGVILLLLLGYRLPVHERVNGNEAVIAAILVLAMVERWRLLATGVLRASDRHVLINTMSICFSLIAATVPFAGCLYFKGGFEIFIFIRGGVTILEITTINIVASRYVEIARGGDRIAHPSDGGRHRSIGWQVFFAAATSILGLLSVWIDRIAVFWSSGVEFYGKYVVLSGAVLFAAGIVNAVTQAFLPTLVRAGKAGEQQSIRVWQDQLRVSLVLCTPVCAFLFTDPSFVREFFFGKAVVPANFDSIVRCLSLYGYLSAFTRIVNAFQVAHGRNEIAMAFNVFSAIAYFPTVFVVAHYFGAFGVALGSVAYLAIFVVAFVIVTGLILKSFPGGRSIARAGLYFIGTAAFLMALETGTRLIAGNLASRIACAIAVVLLSMSVLALIDSTVRRMIVEAARNLRLKVSVASS